MGMKVNGQSVNNIRCASDTLLMGVSVNDIQSILIHVNRSGEKYGLGLNAKKIKVMTIKIPKIKFSKI